MSKRARYLVSQNKKRTVDKTVPHGSVDLDLTEIHPKIVCMGFPASGVEAFYRNSYDDALRYLDFKYGENYVVYNLCQEKAYQYSPDKFHGRVRLYPFLDHHAPPLALLADFVNDAVTYLGMSESRVVVIHCKAGKGRTGVMACALLLAIEPSLKQTAADAMQMYGHQRTRDGRGLTVPGQRRVVEYYGRLLKEYNGKVPDECPLLFISEVRLIGFANHISLRSIKIVINNSLHPIDVKLKDEPASTGAVKCATSYCVGVGGIQASEFTLHCISERRLQGFCGDVQVELYSAGGDCVGVLFVHTLFMERRYEGSVIDKYGKQCTSPDDSAIEFVFSTGARQPPLR